MPMLLVDDNNTSIAVGSTITDFRGDKWIYRCISQNPGNGSQGKISVNDTAGHCREFYPSIFGCKIVDLR